MAATVLLLPLYFAGANIALLDPVPPTDVASELSRWNAWNWLRTALAGAGTIAGIAALATITRR
jgi:hypothetical protein